MQGENSGESTGPNSKEYGVPAIGIGGPMGPMRGLFSSSGVTSAVRFRRVKMGAWVTGSTSSWRCGSQAAPPQLFADAISSVPSRLGGS